MGNMCGNKEPGSGKKKYNFELGWRSLYFWSCRVGAN